MMRGEKPRVQISPIIDGEIATLMLRSEIVKEQSLRDQMIAKMNSLLVTS